MFGRISGYFLLLICVLHSCASETSSEDVFVDRNTIEHLPYYNTPDFSAEWEQVPDGHKIPDFLFTDQNNRVITQKTIENKIYLTNFFFTSCGSICPKMIRNMEIVQDAFKTNPDILFLSHTVNPEKDNVSKLKTYTENFNVDSSKWHFLTGEKSKIYNIARQGYFAEEEIGLNKDSTEFLHTEHFILVDRNQHIRGVYNGTIQLEMNRIIEDIKLLAQE